MDDQLGAYTEEEFRAKFQDIVGSLLKDKASHTCDEPSAVLLGGQSGAGKTTLHKIYAERFDNNVIVVSGDEYRSKHPRYRELDKKYGPESVRYTAPWSGRMTEALVDALSGMGYNLIVEGTLRTAEVSMKTPRLLRERGYAVSLALMAVKPEISLLSCQIRYEQMRIAGTVPRATDPARHNKIVHDIAGNLDVLEESGLFDEVALYTRSEEQLCPRAGGDRRASEVLRDVLFGAWTSEERSHRVFLEGYLAQLRAKESVLELRRKERLFR